jgi:Dolichyl-phosphate-mannose-protein mannosyltransferase
LEVQGRTVLAPGRLSPALAAVWARRWAVLGLAAVVTVSALVVAAQPVRSPWWTYADADASYAATALNLVLGKEVRFVDHPGLQVTEAAAVGFGVDALLHEGSLGHDARQAYVDRLLLDLNRARSVFRGVSIAFYLAGALLAFFLIGRLLGHWTWGLAAGIVWIAAPGLPAMSIQLRPDVPLAVLCLVFAYFIGRALELRSAGYYAAAATVAGFATMLKIHAIGLAAPLLLAIVWRPPAEGWGEQLRSDLRRAARNWVVLALGGTWLLLAVLMNWEQVPFTPTVAQLAVLLDLVVAVVACVAVARVAPRVGGLLALVTAAFAAGLLLPVTLELPAGLQALVNIVKTATGSGVQQGVESFSTPLWRIGDLVSHQVLLVLALAGLGAVLGVVRRDPLPVVLAVGALAMGVLAFARPPNVHYFAPAFVLALPAALWTLRREPGRASLLVWPVVLYLVWPSLSNRHAPAAEANQFAGIVASSKAYVDRRLGRNEIAFVPSYWPFADSRYFELVRLYVEYTPPYRYRYLPTTGAALAFAREHGLRPRYYIGPQAADVNGTKNVPLGELGDYEVRRDPHAQFVLDLVAGPGVTS